MVACTTLAVATAVEAPAFAGSKAPAAANRVLAKQQQATSRPRQIPKVRRVKKGAEKMRGGVATRPIKMKRKLIDLTGSVLLQCGESTDYLAPAAPLADGQGVVDELEIESITYDVGSCDDPRRRTLLWVPAARVSVEELVYPSETRSGAMEARQIEPVARDVSLRIRLLPKLPDSSSEDGALS